MYVKLLRDIPGEELQVIVDQAIAESKFLPTIAELRTMRRNLRNVMALTWVDGWDSVMKAIAGVGSYSVPKFKDPITAQVVKAMGWRELCTSENIEVTRAQFRQMYESYQARGERVDKLLPHVLAQVERNGGMLPMRKLLEVGNGSTNAAP
jgi:hypothetical protein